MFGLAQGQVDCSLLSVTDVINQNDSITFEIYNADTMDTHYPYVSYTLDDNGDTIQKGQLSWYVTPAGSTSYYYYTNYGLNFVLPSNLLININYPLSIYFTYSNLTGEIPGDYTCEVFYNPQNNSSSCEANLIEGCVSIAVWDPVCGCDDETYSNSADAACNSIYEYTNGECIEVIYGCTNPINQFNYNPSATSDDSSCISPCFLSASNSGEQIVSHNTIQSLTYLTLPFSAGGGTLRQLEYNISWRNHGWGSSSSASNAQIKLYVLDSIVSLTFTYPSNVSKSRNLII